MPKQIVIAEQHRVAAVFSEDQIQELIVATGTHQVGDIYLGTVENVLPGIDAAFINLGDTDRNGFMHVSDLGPLRLRKAAGSITELVAPQQKVLVQIMKEPTGNKGPRLTGKVTLPGRYLVLMPYGRGVNLSRRIRNESERHRLRALGILVKPPGMGLLVRTEAEGVSEEAIIEDLEALQKRWKLIQEEAMTTRAPALLNRDDDFIQRVLRDVYSSDVNRIVTDSSVGQQRVKQHLTNWSGGRVPIGVLIDYHRTETPILEYFRVNAAIREALKPRVDLPSGGYIIIEPTEALTVIDVNSGSFTRSATARETVLWTNCEAAVEIARQLRLRNIAGVIVVDFIDMDARRDQMQVLENFGKSLLADKARPQITQLSELGLVELTRKRQGKNIYELFGRPCPSCGGLGHVVQLPGEAPVAVERSVINAREAYRASEFAPTIAGSAGSGVASASVAAIPMPTRYSASRELPRTEAADAYQDLQSLDLLNHPDYQDKSMLRGNGRNRRRRRGNEGAPASGSSKVVAGRLPLLPKEADVLEESVATNKVVLESNEASVSMPRGRGGRTRNGRSRRQEEPPEMVAVEMTPEEQQVFAAMGVSPLVLSTQTVKDPKNTLISVLLPGEAATFTLPAAVAAPVEVEADVVEPANPWGNRSSSSYGSSARQFDDDDDDDTPPPARPMLVNKVILRDVSREASPVAAAVPVVNDSMGGSAPIPAVVAAEAAPDLDAEADNRRRRRRRSSSADE
jgi:ribonuclease E